MGSGEEGREKGRRGEREAVWKERRGEEGREIGKEEKMIER